MTMSEEYKSKAKPEKNTHGKNALAAPTTRRGNAHSANGFFHAVYEQNKHRLIGFFDAVHGQQKKYPTAFS